MIKILRYQIQILFWLILFQPVQVFCQPEIAWQRCYGGSKTDRFFDALITNDNGVIASIEHSSSDGDLEGYPASSGWIIKYNAAMEVEWEQHYGTEDCPIAIYKIIELPNGNLAFGGTNAGYATCTDAVGGDGDYAVLITDPYGNLITSGTAGSMGTDYFSDFIHTQDNGFLVTAESLSEGGDIPFHYYGDMGSTDVVIYKLDSMLNLQWLRNLGGSSYDVVGGSPFEISRGHYVVQIGTTSNDHDLAGSGIIGGKRWVIELDSVGTIIKENFISVLDVPNGDGSSFMFNNQIAVVGGGEFQTGLFPIPEGHANAEGYIGFMDTSTLAFTHFYHWGGTGLDFLENSAVDEYGNYYFLGYSRSTNYDLPGNYNMGETFDYWILSTDSNFQLRWSRNFGGADPCGDLRCSSYYGDLLYKDNMLYAFIANTVPDVLPDMDIQCGHLNPDGDNSSDAWLVAFSVPVDIQEAQKPVEMLQIFPNPTTGIFQLSFSEPLSEMMTIEVFDITNRRVYISDMVGMQTMELNLEHVQSGMYVVRATTASGLISLKNIVIQ